MKLASAFWMRGRLAWIALARVLSRRGFNWEGGAALLLAPDFNRKATIDVSPCWRAMSRAVHPLSAPSLCASFALTSAPCSTNIFTTSSGRLSDAAAYIRGVLPQRVDDVDVGTVVEQHLDGIHVACN